MYILGFYIVTHIHIIVNEFRSVDLIKFTNLELSISISRLDLTTSSMSIMHTHSVLIATNMGSSSCPFITDVFGCSI